MSVNLEWNVNTQVSSVLILPAWKSNNFACYCALVWNILTTICQSIRRIYYTLIHAAPKSFKEQENFKEVFQLLTIVQNHVTSIATSGIGEAEKKIEIVSYELGRIMDRLNNGIVRVGIIGLPKAGKSTSLNAWLGKHFLPSSIQPQTAREVVIVHDTSKPEGELYCNTVDTERILLASGQKDIHRKLLKLNDETRDKTKSEAGAVKCDKLILHAPLLFLADVRDVKLELSDTPGFGEAGEADIAKGVNITVKDMCAFVLIMNSQNMKTSTELELLHKLKYHHPQLFSKLNRVLILVNAHTNVYSEGALGIDNASVTPEKLPEYVSNFLKSPEFLNEDIQPQQVLVFHALWALRSRDPIWPENVTKATILYNEALQMLRFVGKGKEADALKDDMSTENINRALSLLEPASQIESVEEQLRNMVVENGMLVLLESAVDDSVSVISNTLIPIILKLIEEEHVEAKQNKVQSAEELDKLFKDLLRGLYFDTASSSITSSSQKHVTTLRDTLQESLKAIISSKLADTLTGTTELEVENDVIKEMCRARDSIPYPALEKMKREWLTMSGTIKDVATYKMKQAFSDIKASFLPTLSKIGSTESTVHELVEKLIPTISMALDHASENSASLVPSVSSLPIDKLQTKAVPDNAIGSYVRKSTKQDFKPGTKTICDGGFLGTGLFEDCDDIPIAIPYEKTVFSANINAFKSAFDNVIQTWLDQFVEQATKLPNQISTGAAAAGKKKLSNILKEPHERVTELLQSSQNSLNESQQHVAFLRKKLDDLRNIAESLGSV